MEKTLELRAVPREIIGKKVSRLRRQGIVPGVIYGHDIGSIPIQFDRREVEKSLSQAGTSTTVQVYIEGTEEPYLAIYRDVQYHPIKRTVRHLDLQALDVKEIVHVPVSVNLVGEAPAVEEVGSMLLQLMNELEIEALPTALVPSIEVDVSGLTEIGQSIMVGDITPPEGVTILSAPNEPIVQVTWIEEIEEEEEELEEVLMPGDVEVIGRGAEEEEELEEAEIEE